MFEWKSTIPTYSSTQPFSNSELRILHLNLMGMFQAVFEGQETEKSQGNIHLLQSAVSPNITCLEKAVLIPWLDQFLCPTLSQHILLLHSLFSSLCMYYLVFLRDCKIYVGNDAICPITHCSSPEVPPAVSACPRISGQTYFLYKGGLRKERKKEGTEGGKKKEGRRGREEKRKEKDVF